MPQPLYSGSLSPGALGVLQLWQLIGVKAAEARVKLLKHAAEVRRDVEADHPDTVSDKLSRWMRDKTGG